MGETLPRTEWKRNAYRTLVAIPEGKRPFKRVGVDGMIL
jgi:hypothetical protein